MRKVSKGKRYRSPWGGTDPVRTPAGFVISFTPGFNRVISRPNLIPKNRFNGLPFRSRVRKPLKRLGGILLPPGHPVETG
jgi:hypothetical protein